MGDVKATGPDDMQCWPGGADAQERAAAVDRTYFETHPTEREYMREALPGEWVVVGAPPGTVMVRVIQVRPGVRIRQPAYIVVRSPMGQLSRDEVQ